ncbi:DUF2188 domain-containing protein [Stenotrophomonas sp. AB1(2024)]|jgi:hypothetical protein|uniref:DUF2188 domain-containing protein n=1 Tax=Stenotrophomonas sp. AB1(2024) TaxID=3132215 RepID=UPI0030A3F696
MNKKSQHVVPSTSGGWAVRRSGAERASKLFVTQKEAIAHARTIAKSEKGELYVHGRDGTIKEKSSFGHDPIPPKAKR